MAYPRKILIDLQYFPCLEYFICLRQADVVVMDLAEHYVKQSYRNRCHINTPLGVDVLSVPVVGGNKKVPSGVISIDYKQKWINRHWRAIQSAYGKTPFFDYYAPYWEAIFKQAPATLKELNAQLLTKCLEFLQWDLTWQYASHYMAEPLPDFVDLRGYIHPKKKYGLRQFYISVAYPQNFGKAFEGNLSIVDLLCCEGPNAGAILDQSAKMLAG